MVTTFATTRNPTVGLGSKTFFAAAVLITLSSFAKETATVLLDLPRTVSNMFELTAAHRNLPFGSKVRVTDLRNRKSVIVTITDRGVLNPGRVIDLSYAAAERLDMLRAGVDPVRLDVLTKKQALLAEADVPPQP